MTLSLDVIFFYRTPVIDDLVKKFSNYASKKCEHIIYLFFKSF